MVCSHSTGQCAFEDHATMSAMSTLLTCPEPSISSEFSPTTAGTPTSPVLPTHSNESRTLSSSTIASKPYGKLATHAETKMAGPPGAARSAPSQASARNSSMDSVITAISTKSSTNKGLELSAETNDIAHLIQTAGSPEAVIQYMLKDKISQTQQNSQLWRLVDKQRAMILGLNKDLEKALKEKEKYRRKLKEVVAATDVPPLPMSTARGTVLNAVTENVAPETTKEYVVEIPVSPTLDSDSQKHSPVDVSLAPYPITPPADQPHHDEPPAVRGLLDPSHSMPKASDHALDQYDHQAREEEAEAARREAEQATVIPIHMSLPPSRSLPREPPRIPPPSIPPPQVPLTASPETYSSAPPAADSSLSQFPVPPVNVPRKPPPAPLQLQNAQPSSTATPEDDGESDSAYDDVLEVEEIPANAQRGRRRTREEDELSREIPTAEDAERRTLSDKSSQNFVSSQVRLGFESLAPPASPAPLGPLLSPGLPSSPRALMTIKSPVTSPPLSPLGLPMLSGQAPSPRAPRQAIPLPTNTPLQTPLSPAVQPPVLLSPRPLNIVKKFSVEKSEIPSPTASSSSSSAERHKIYKGFMTDEYPDLLIPPNALLAVEIKVASSRMKPSRASLLSLTQLEEDPVFTLAICSRADGGELWRVEKDSLSLAKLDQRLRQCPAFTARTPDRSLFTGHAPAKLDARRIALNQYWDELLNTPLDTATALELCKYLSNNTLPPNTDDTGAVAASTNEAPQVGPGGRPFRSGYLTKRGKNFGGWKARFFVLESSYLKYYEAPGAAHLGTIKLPKAQIGKQSEKGNEGSPARSTGTDDAENQYRHAFLILEPKKKDPNSVTKHVLCAESDEERDQWVDALLRWIDYEAPKEQETKRDPSHDRHVTAGEHGAPQTRKKGHNGKHTHQQGAESSETLIGVNYEVTRQGDAPDSTPPRPKHTGHYERGQEQAMSSQSSFAFSGPRDSHPVAYSDSRASKLGMSLTPPNQEEKKARKRSFFGFGTKSRSSSDGQDSLYGESGNSASLPANQYNGPVRQVFGASLADAVRYNSPVDVQVPLPAVVYRCVQYLEAKGAINEEGIFRLSGSNVLIKQLRERFNEHSDINLLLDEQYYDIHAVASLLKLYLRELPTTILTRDLHLQFLAVTEMSVLAEKTAALNELVQRLPQANGTLLKFLIAFLIKIINNADTNKMTVRNVGIVFSPTLNIPAPIFAMFLQHFEAIFSIEPMEYQLPGHRDGSERHPSQPSNNHSRHDRRPSDGPTRPSTSNGSPHRQRLMEAVKEGQGMRKSSTPPPIMNMHQLAQLNAMRTTPTPPPLAQQRPPNFDAQYYSQQGPGANRISMRPAYEGGFASSAGWDPGQMPPPGGRPHTGHERPGHEAAAPSYEQAYGTRNPRRESMMMGPRRM